MTGSRQHPTGFGSPEHRSCAIFLEPSHAMLEIWEMWRPDAGGRFLWKTHPKSWAEIMKNCKELGLSPASEAGQAAPLCRPKMGCLDSFI